MIILLQCDKIASLVFIYILCVYKHLHICIWKIMMFVCLETLLILFFSKWLILIIDYTKHGNLHEIFKMNWFD